MKHDARAEMMIINMPPLWQNARHFIGVGQRFDSVVSMSPCVAACAIDLDVLKTISDLLTKHINSCNKIHFKGKGVGIRAAGPYIHKRVCSENSHMLYIPGHFLLSKAAGNHVALS